MSIIDTIKNWIAGEQDPGAKYNKEVDALDKKIHNIMAKENTRREHISDCVVLMKDCRKKFAATIAEERNIAKEKSFSNLPTKREEDRVKEAAIGILTVDMALFDLDSISSESDMNKAMNSMGKALRQLVRLDNSTTAISASARNFIDMFFPGFKAMVAEGENYTAVKRTSGSAKSGQPTDLVSIYEIPKEIRDRIDSAFVDNLMKGDTYEIANFKAQKGSTVKQAEGKTEAYPVTGAVMSEEEKKRIAALAGVADTATLVKGVKNTEESTDSQYNT